MFGRRVDNKMSFEFVVLQNGFLYFACLEVILGTNVCYSLGSVLFGGVVVGEADCYHGCQDGSVVSPCECAAPTVLRPLLGLFLTQLILNLGNPSHRVVVVR